MTERSSRLDDIRDEALEEEEPSSPPGDDDSWLARDRCPNDDQDERLPFVGRGVSGGDGIQPLHSCLLFLLRILSSFEGFFLSSLERCGDDKLPTIFAKLEAVALESDWRREMNDESF